MFFTAGRISQLVEQRRVEEVDDPDAVQHGGKTGVFYDGPTQCRP